MPVNCTYFIAVPAKRPPSFLPAMKPKSALFFLLCPLLSLGGMSVNPAQAQIPIRERCLYAEIYVEDEPPIEPHAVCQAVRPLAAEGLKVAIFVTNSTYSTQWYWNSQQAFVKSRAGLQRFGDQNFAPDGLFLAVISSQLVVLDTPVVLTLGGISYSSSTDADQITEAITQEIEAGLRDDALTEGIVNALGTIHRLLYSPSPSISMPALIMPALIMLSAGVIIILGGALLYRRRNQFSPSPQQLEQIQRLISTLPDSRSAEVESCEQTRQWVEDITKRSERYTLGLKEMVRFIEVEVTQKRGVLNFCRRLWRRGQPRFPKPELKGAKGQDYQASLSLCESEKSGHLFTSSTPAPATNANASLDIVGAKARQRIALIEHLISQKHYLPALEVWKQAQIELVQFAIAQLQQRQQAAKAHSDHYSWRDKKIAKYSQYMETIAQRLKSGNITELLKLQGDLVSLLDCVKLMEQSADWSLKRKKDEQRQAASGSGGEMSSKDVDGIINSMFDSDRSSGSSSSWSSGSSSSRGSSSRSSGSRGSSSRSSGSRGSSRRR